MDFKPLVDEAELALRQADPLCVEANKFFQECRQNVEEAVILWAKAQFLQDAFQSQLQIMGNAYILLNHTIEGSDSTSTDSLKRLQKSDHNLSALLTQLENTALHDDPERNLYSFVHDVDIKNLQKQVGTLTEGLKVGVGALTRLPAQVQKEISQLRDSMPRVQNETLVNDLNHMSESATTNISDMAGLLDSITQHYDQCCEASTLTDENEIIEIQQVLEQDRLQLQDALKTLQAHYSLMENYHKNILNSVSDMTALIQDFSAFYKKTDTFVRVKLRMYIDQLEERNSQLKDRFLKVNELIDEINGLCEYYKLFKQGYAALLKEKQRRQKYDEHMSRLLVEINSSISKQYQKELNSRTEFIQAYGEFLPNDIWDNLYDVPKLHVLTSAPSRDENNTNNHNTGYGSNPT